MIKIPLLILVALLAFGALGASGQYADNKSAGVMKAVADYDAAWNKKDLDGVSRMLAADYVYFSSTGSLTDRKQTLALLGSPDYKLTFVERSEIQILSIASRDRTVVVSSRWKGRGTFGTEEINDDQRCGLVFVRDDKAWKLISEHCTQIAKK